MDGGRLEISPEADLIQCLRSSERILAVLGAGLSRPSGLPTFRQDPGFWGRAMDEVATMSAFNKDPIYVWTVYERLRQLALTARPNPGHYALAALAAKKPGFLAITQNIDDLSQKAGHNDENLVALHGSLFNIRCSSESCSFAERNVRPEPIVPGLVVSSWDPSDPRISLPQLQRNSIPHCPVCKSGIIRPGVVWFGEKLPQNALDRIENWLCMDAEVDLVLIIGTERTPFVYDAIERGALVAIFNIFQEEIDPEHVCDADWVVNGDVSQTLPNLIGSAFG